MMNDMFDEDFDAFATSKSGQIKTFHGGVATSETKRHISCYETHKPMSIGGGTVYGGACGWPIIKDADIYVGLDSSMNFQNPARFPWHVDHGGPVEFLFRISDGQAPVNAEEFKNMITWLAEQLKLGKSVHVGCIGGHGRTGMVLAALVKVTEGIEDAISYVREHYCPKVVESQVQVQFLHKHFGIKPVIGSRNVHVQHVHKGIVSSGRSHLKSADQMNTFEGWLESGESRKAAGAQKPPVPTLPLAQRRTLPAGVFAALPCASLASVWGTGVKTEHERKKKATLRLDKQIKPDNIKSSQEGAT